MPFLRRSHSADLSSSSSMSGSSTQTKVAEAMRSLRQDFEDDQSSVFDMELSNHGTDWFTPNLTRLASVRDDDFYLNGEDDVNGALSSVIRLCKPATQFEVQLLEVVRQLKPSCSTPEGFKMNALAEKLSHQGYRVQLRDSVPQDGTGRHPSPRDCLHCLRHTYIVCTGRDDTPFQVEFIVEPRLRDQFELAHPTTAYSTLLKAVPQEYVGTPDRLRKFTELLSAEVAATFKEHDLPLPPWRRQRSMLSKWSLHQRDAQKSPLPMGDIAVPQQLTNDSQYRTSSNKPSKGSNQKLQVSVAATVPVFEPQGSTDATSHPRRRSSSTILQGAFVPAPIVEVPPVKPRTGFAPWNVVGNVYKYAETGEARRVAACLFAGFSSKKGKRATQGTPCVHAVAQ